VDPTTGHSRHVLTGSALIALGAIAFSAKAVLIKLAYADSAGIDAVTLMTLRMLLALPVFLVAAAWNGGPEKHTRGGRDWAALLTLGVTGYYLAALLDFEGLKYIPAGLERLILFLYPTIVVLLTALLYRRPVGRPQRWALALSYAGILLVYIEHPHTASGNVTLGAVLVFGSAVAFALFLTGSGHLIPRFGSRRFTAYSMSVACAATVTHFLAPRTLERAAEKLTVSTRLFALSLALALLCTVTPAFLMNAGIRRIGADRAAIVASIGPVATLGLAYVVLHETLDPYQIAGSVMVLGGDTERAFCRRDRGIRVRVRNTAGQPVSGNALTGR